MARSMCGAEFAVTVPLMKAWQDQEGAMWFEGVASSTALDRQQERMTPQAISKMTHYAGIDLLPSHNAAVLDELGTVEECWADNDTFRIRGKLDSTNPKAQRLYKQLAAGRRYGLSVGGRVLKAHWENNAAAGGPVRHIDDVELDHVAVCRAERAVNTETYLAVMAKAAGAVTEEQDAVRRIGQAVVEACRALWPFSKAEAPAEATEGDAELNTEEGEADPRGEEAWGCGDEAVAKAADEGICEGEEVVHGRPQSLAGQERQTGANGRELWKGVL